MPKQFLAYNRCSKDTERMKESALDTYSVVMGLGKMINLWH